MFLKRCEPIIKRPYYVTSCVSYLIKEGSTEFWIDETSVAIYKDIQNEAITKKFPTTWSKHLLAHRKSIVPLSKKPMGIDRL